jgi:hypothetical protein
MPTINVYLSNLNTNIDVSNNLTIEFTPPDQTIGNYDIVSNINIPLSLNTPFYIGISNEEISQAFSSNNDDDLIFMTQKDNFISLFDQTDYQIADSSIFFRSNTNTLLVNESEIIQNIDTNSLNVVDYYILYIAKQIFNTAAASVLFNNTDNVINTTNIQINNGYINTVNRNANYWGDIYFNNPNNPLLYADNSYPYPYTFNSSMTPTYSSNINPCEIIYKSISKNAPERLISLPSINNTYPYVYKINLIPGDIISFKLTLRPPADQYFKVIHEPQPPQTRIISPITYLIQLNFVPPEIVSYTYNGNAVTVMLTRIKNIEDFKGIFTDILNPAGSHYYNNIPTSIISNNTGYLTDQAAFNACITGISTTIQYPYVLKIPSSFFSTLTNNKMPINNYDIYYNQRYSTGLPCKYNSENGYVIIAISG